MHSKEPCEFCPEDLPTSSSRCPHCGQPGRFPNTRIANQSEEREALAARYEQAMKEATGRSYDAVLKKFEDQTISSYAVIARDYAETLRLSSDDDEVYSTYHRLVEAGHRVPGGDDFNRRRTAFESAVLGPSYEDIRFGALSLDGIGVKSYGNTSWILSEAKIAHRTSIFEENPEQFMRRHQILAADIVDLPRGYRAVWKDRGRLCVAKLGSRLEPDTKEEDFAGVLLQQGSSREHDDFVEVHIDGPLTVRSWDRVIVTEEMSKALFKALRIRLDRFGVTLEARGWMP